LHRFWKAVSDAVSNFSPVQRTLGDMMFGTGRMVDMSPAILMGDVISRFYSPTMTTNPLNLNPLR